MRTLMNFHGNLVNFKYVFEEYSIFFHPELKIKTFQLLSWSWSTFQWRGYPEFSCPVTQSFLTCDVILAVESIKSPCTVALKCPRAQALAHATVLTWVRLTRSIWKVWPHWLIEWGISIIQSVQTHHIIHHSYARMIFKHY